jgi:hypothetical protein
MPGPMGRIMTWTPVPWQVPHSSRLPLLLPVPLHLPQGSLRERDSFLHSADARGRTSQGGKTQARQPELPADAGWPLLPC